MKVVPICALTKRNMVALSGGRHPWWNFVTLCLRGRVESYSERGPVVVTPWAELSEGQLARYLDASLAAVEPKSALELLAEQAIAE